MSSARVRRFLDLSTAHLPEQVMNGPLNSFAHVVAYEFEFGALLWVPPIKPDNDIEDLAAQGVPEEIVHIWRYARSLDCDYVLFDRDADTNDDLPTWEW